MSFGLNQKGQAFDTFKLLIAAIIAIAILGILLSILNIVQFPWQSDPTKETINSISTALSSYATAQTTTKVVFNSSKDTLTNAAIARGGSLSIGEDQICLVKGYYGDSDSVFRYVSGNEGKAIELSNKGSSREVRISVLCDSGRDNIESDLQLIPSVQTDAEKGDGLGVCDNVPTCQSGTGSTEPCCIVVLRSGGGT